MRVVLNVFYIEDVLKKISMYCIKIIFFGFNYLIIFEKYVIVLL